MKEKEGAEADSEVVSSNTAAIKTLRDGRTGMEPMAARKPCMCYNVANIRVEMAGWHVGQCDGEACHL